MVAEFAFCTADSITARSILKNMKNNYFSALGETGLYLYYSKS